MYFRRRSASLPGRGSGVIDFLDLGDPDRAVDLVFMHATGFNALTYRRLLSSLPDARVLVLDQRGHGFTTLTTETEGRRNWYDFRDDLLSFLDLLDLRDVVLSGHSMGGTISLFAAASAPERLRRLVLFDPVIPPRDRSFASGQQPPPIAIAAAKRRAVYPDRATAIAAYRGRGAFRTWPDDVLDDYVHGGFVDLPSGEVTLACRPQWEASTFASQDHDAWAAFSQSRCPIRIIKAQNESTCYATEDSVAAGTGGRITVETVPGTTHFLPMEQPDFCRNALSDAIHST